MSLLGALALGIAIGAALEALVVSALVGWRDTPNAGLALGTDEATRGGER